MPNKTDLITAIKNYEPFDEIEHRHVDDTLKLLAGTDQCFLRSDFPGHINGGLWLLSPDHSRVLLTHHKILNQWFQFGGHADGDQDIAVVALREGMEESSIDQIELITPDIFDIDVHPIPANPKRNEPAHLHYEIRYLGRAKHMNYTITDESHDVRWFTPSELTAMNLGPSRQRMIDKWQRFLLG